MERETSSGLFPLGSQLPNFELLNVDGKRIGSEHMKGSKAALVAFLCNHCPYVKGSEDMLISIVKRYPAEVLSTGVLNSNAAGEYP
jgi:hypothetical protein